MLALSEIEDRHYSRFFVLWGIPAEYCGNEVFIFGSEFKGDGGVVVGGVAVLWRRIS